MAKLYDEKSIESLSPLEFTRLRPGVYAGDTTYSTQLLIEVFSNAVDEFNAGHGNQIDVTIDKDVVTVEDYGKGLFLIVSAKMAKQFLKQHLACLIPQASIEKMVVMKEHHLVLLVLVVK